MLWRVNHLREIALTVVRKLCSLYKSSTRKGLLIPCSQSRVSRVSKPIPAYGLQSLITDDDLTTSSLNT